MEKLLKSEKFESKKTSANAAANFVDCVHSSAHPSLGEGERFICHWSLNFENVTQEQILEAAAESFIIKIRRKFVDDKKPADADWDHAQFDVAQFITTRKSKVEKLAEQLADLDDDALAALGITRTAK